MPYLWNSRRPDVRSLSLALLLTLAVIAVAAVLAAPALAYDPWEHGGARESTCDSSGCHRDQTPTNTACLQPGCHVGYAAAPAKKCWDCHEPGTRPAADCAASCHLYRTRGDDPVYDVAFTHGATPHLGASGYGKTCAGCHGAGNKHHDATKAATPTCAACHNGTYAKVPAGHEGRSANCATCHLGMSRPTNDCAACHVGNPSSGGPQIAYSNTLSCGDAACHGKVANHAGTPIGAAACTTCHTAHYATLGDCTKCHSDPRSYHHATASAIPLSQCAACHNGGIAAAPTGHSGFGTDCESCHDGMNVPSGACMSCHDKAQGSYPAVGYTNDLTCGDARCHGMVANHEGTPIGGVPCTRCHVGHYEARATCVTCHADPQRFHHGTTRALELADCEACHNGTMATSKTAHAGLTCVTCHDDMTPPDVPAKCNTCHEADRFGTVTCTACHSTTGMFATEQVHHADPHVACTTCHRPHYADVGTCATCHAGHAETHHAQAAPAASTLTVTASKKRIARGARVRIGGVLGGATGPLAAQRIVLQARATTAKTFKSVVTLRTRADGSYARWLRPKVSTQYRVLFKAAGDIALQQKPAVATASVRVTRR